MQGKKEKPKVRLVRNSDGSLRPSGSANKDNKNDGLQSAWAAQESFLASSNTTLKQELKRAKKLVNTRFNSIKDKSKAKKEPNNHNHDKTTASIADKSSFIIKSYITRRNTVIVVVVALVLAGSLALIGGKNDKPASGSQVAGEVDAVQIVTGVTPSFPVLSIKGSGEVPGGYARINPPGVPDTYAYLDSLQGVPIKVSQQKAPDGVLSDPSKMNDLAEQFGATDSFEAGEIIVYQGRSMNGIQSLLYTKGGLLVLIVADNVITNSDWIEYISNLQF